MKNRYRNSILLTAIGDGLGWITEFERSSNSVNKKYGIEEITEFIDWQKNVGGRFNGYIDHISQGSYSDDTQLLLSVARSIDEHGNLDNEYFSKIELASWLKYARGAGRTIKNAAKKIARHSAKWNDNFFTYKAGKETLSYKDSGANGAAMRILPLALRNYKDQEKLKRQIFENSIITHGHPRAIVGALIYGLAISSALTSNSDGFSYTKYLTSIGSNLKTNLNLDSLMNLDIEFWMNKWNDGRLIKFSELYNQTLEESLNSLRQIFTLVRDKVDDKESLIKLGCFDPKTKGSGISTVSAGIYLASKYINSPSSAIITAANMIGTDTDSIAAFTGGILGAVHEDDIIPNKFKKVQDRAYLESVADALYHKTNTHKMVLPFQTSYPSAATLNDKVVDVFHESQKIEFTPLGPGKIVCIDRQDALTSGKYNLILDVEFDLGQTCKFSKLLNK